MKDEHPSRGRRLTRAEINEIIDSPEALRAKANNPRIARTREIYDAEAAAILTDLRALGYTLDRQVGELLRLGVQYKSAIPVLIRWLPHVDYLRLAEDIIRTLSVSFAKKQAFPMMLEMFRNPPDLEDPQRPVTSESPKEHIRWVIGNALSIYADASIAEDLIELARDRSYGKARTSIVSDLPKVKDERVPQVLLELLDDPTVTAFAIQALGKIRYSPARARIEEMLDNSDENIRYQAKKALKRIDPE